MDEIDPIVMQMKSEMQSQKLKQNLNGAFDVNPDQQAQRNVLSQRSGVPALTLDSPEYETWVQNMTKQNDIAPDDLIKSHPMTAQGLSDEQFAKIAHDDVENLKNLEDAFSVVGKTKSSTIDELLANTEKQAALAGYLMLAYGPEGQDIDAMAQFIAARNKPLAQAQANAPDYVKNFQKSLADADGYLADAGVLLSNPRAVARSAVTQLPNMLLPSATSILGAKGGAATGAAVGSGVALALGQFGPQVAAPEEIVTVPSFAVVGASVGTLAGTVSGGFAGGSLVEIAAWLDQELSQAGVDVTDAAQIAEKFKDPEFMGKAKARAEAKGLTTAGIDALWNATFAGRFLKGMKPASTLSGVVRNAGQVAKDVGVQAVGESVSEAGGQFAATGKVDSGEVLLEGFSSLGQSVFDTTLYGKIRKGDVDTAAAEVAKAKMAEVEGLHNAATAAKTVQRDPAAVKAMIDSHSPASRVYVDGEVAAKYFQELDDPSQKRLEEVIPDLRQRIQEAQDTGADVELNRSDYVAYIASTEQGKTLMEYVKFSVDDLTVAQLTDPAYLESLYEMVDESSQKNEFTAFRERLSNELVDSGRFGSKSIAQASVEPLAAFIETMQARGGTEDVTQSLLQGISAEGPQGAPRKLLDAKDVEINQIREYAAQVAKVHEANQKRLDTRREKAKAKAQAEGRTYVEPKPRGKSRNLPILKLLAKRGGVKVGSPLASELKARDVTPKTAPWLFVKEDRRTVTPQGVVITPAFTDLDQFSAQDLNAELGVDIFRNTGTDVTDTDAYYVSQNDIFDAIDRELFGKPVTQDVDERAAYFDDALEYFDRLGVDIETATNEQIRQAMADSSAFLNGDIADNAAPDPDGVTYNQSGQIKTETDAFKKWFGKSKIVDKKGKPLVVYHGSYSNFEAFSEQAVRDSDPDGFFSGFHFGNKEQANSRLDRFGQKGRDNLARFKKYPNIMPVYLKIENPLRVEDVSNNESWQNWIDEAKEQGYDGLVYANLYEGVGEKDSYVAFYPEQIKSVNNEGTFDIKNQNILKQKNRGQVSMLRDGRYIIKLFATSDLSTFLHESGHVFLDALNRYASAPDATQEIKDYMKTVLEYLEVDSYANVTVEKHEKFARAIENYFKAGEAPSVRLQSVMQKFKAWLVRIYGKINQMGAPVTPELKDVFDRLFATDQEIAQVSKGDPFKLNDDVLSILPEADQERYRKLHEKALEQAKERLFKKSLAQKEREITKWWKEEREKLRAETEREVHNDPIYRLKNFLKTGEFYPDDELVAPPAAKISSKAAKQALGTTIMANMPKGYFSKGGVSPDMMAEVVGYYVGNADEGFRLGTGNELLLALANSKEDAKARIDRLTNEEMRRRHGDLIVDGTIEREALEAYHSDAQALKIEMEGKAAAKLAGIKFGSNTNFELAAQKMLSGKRVQDAGNADRFYRGAVKAAREYGKAIKGKDYARAVKAKQQQLLSHHLYKQSLEARRTVDKTILSWQRLTKSDELLTQTKTRTVDGEKIKVKMDINYVYVARAILGRYGVLPYSPANLQTFFNNIKADDPEAFEDLLLAVENNTRDIPQAESRTVNITQGRLAGREVVQTKQPWTKLTYEEFLGLKDTIDNILVVGRDRRTMTIDGVKVDIDDVRAELENRIAELPATSISDGSVKALEWHDKGKLALSGIRAGLRRVESWAQAMDGTYGGVFRKYIWNPINEARGAYLVAQHEYLDKMVELLKPHDERLNGSGKIAGNEIGYTFHSKSELIGFMLHTGNESNWYKLWKGGRGKGSWSPANVQAMIERMMNDGTITKEDMDLVQSMWDLVDSLKPQAQKAHKAMYGYYFSEITQWPINTPWGEYRGGYWPAIADNYLSQDSRIRQDQENLITVNNSSMFPTTGRGFTKSRVENYAAPLAFDLKLLPSHVDKVLRFVHLEPAVKDVAKLVNNKEFRKAIEVVDPRAAEDMLVPWLQRVARQTVETNDSKWFKYIDPAARWLRSTTSAQAMMLNFLNAIQQVTGFAPAIYKVGARPFSKSFVQFMKNPVVMNQKMMDASPFMRYRNTTLADNLQKSVLDITLDTSKYKKVKDAAQAHGYIMQQVMQTWVDGTTWWASYDKALADGLNEKEAVRFADSVIRETQGSTSATDLSRIEAGPATMRLFTMFYSYFNTQSNLLTTEAQNIVRQTSGLDRTGKLTYLYLMCFAAPAFMAELLVRSIKGTVPDDEDDDGTVVDEWLAWFVGSQFRYVTAMVPWVGQFTNSVVNTFDEKPYNDRISISPVLSTAETVARAPKSVYKAIADDGDVSRAVQDTLTSIGFLTGLPLGQFGKPLGYAADVAEGDAEVNSIFDPLQGIVAGPPPASGR